MTRTTTVQGRFRAHQNAGTRYDLKKFLQKFPGYPQRFDDYQIRWVLLDQLQDRIFFEHFAIGVLWTPFDRLIRACL
jgi:hypothetical protein